MLQDTIPADEFTMFTEKGYFTIRTLDEFWGGNFSDQTIEQFLMWVSQTVPELGVSMHYLAVFLFVMHWSSLQGCTLLPQSNIKTCA